MFRRCVLVVDGERQRGALEIFRRELPKVTKTAPGQAFTNEDEALRWLKSAD